MLRAEVELCAGLWGHAYLRTDLRPGSEEAVRIRRRSLLFVINEMIFEKRGKDFLKIISLKEKRARPRRAARLWRSLVVGQSFITLA